MCIRDRCAIISPSEAKPGDIIFFTGTYDSPGPVSHVGIYVGDASYFNAAGFDFAQGAKAAAFNFFVNGITGYGKENNAPKLAASVLYRYFH